MKLNTTTTTLPRSSKAYDMVRELIHEHGLNTEPRYCKYGVELYEPKIPTNWPTVLLVNFQTYEMTLVIPEADDVNS